MRGEGVKLDVLIATLRKGPCSSLTLMQKSKFRTKASLSNALAVIPNVRRISVDAGCRPILVYWMEGDYVRKPALRTLIPKVLDLRAQGKSLKLAMRELKIECLPNTVEKACRDYKRRLEAAE